MTDFAHDGSHNVVTAAFHWVGKTLSGYGDGMRAAMRAHDAYENYSMMSDSALANIGLTRERLPLMS